MGIGLDISFSMSFKFANATPTRGGGLTSRPSREPRSPQTRSPTRDVRSRMGSSFQEASDYVTPASDTNRATSRTITCKRDGETSVENDNDEVRAKTVTIWALSFRSPYGEHTEGHQTFGWGIAACIGPQLPTSAGSQLDYLLASG